MLRLTFLRAVTRLPTTTTRHQLPVSLRLDRTLRATRRSRPCSYSCECFCSCPRLLSCSSSRRSSSPSLSSSSLSSSSASHHPRCISRTAPSTPSFMCSCSCTTSSLSSSPLYHIFPPLDPPPSLSPSLAPKGYTALLVFLPISPLAPHTTIKYPLAPPALPEGPVQGGELVALVTPPSQHLLL